MKDFINKKSKLETKIKRLLINFINDIPELKRDADRNIKGISINVHFDHSVKCHSPSEYGITIYDIDADITI